MSFQVLANWQTKAGYKAVVIKTDMGHNCGYVGIKYGHSLFCASILAGKRGATMDIVFDVHGSVTFTDGGKNSTYPVKSNLWWIGFDCGHCDDTPEKCDLEYCEIECESLAKQIKEVTIATTRKALR